MKKRFLAAVLACIGIWLVLVFVFRLMKEEAYAE